MANLSLREVAQSQLDQAPVIDGQLIVCTDTGSTYRDIGTRRIQISKDLEIVSSLPLAPLSNKIYYLRPDSLYVYSGDDWILLNPSKFTLEADKNAVNGEVNINLILNGTAQDKIKIAGGGVTTVTTGETGDITIDTPHPDELLAALTNEEIDAITGGMVDDSGSGTVVEGYTKAQVDNKIAAAIKVAKEEQKLLDHPVGSIYQSVEPTSPAELFGGEWKSIGSGRVLMGADNNHAVGTTVEAGLPNITGEYLKRKVINSSNGVYNDTQRAQKAFKVITSDATLNTVQLVTNSASNVAAENVIFDASGSNSIYGASDTVQPPAYYVYM